MLPDRVSNPGPLNESGALPIALRGPALYCCILLIKLTTEIGMVGYAMVLGIFPVPGAMVLGKFIVPGRPTIWITVGHGPTALAVGAGRGCLDIFTLICPFSPLSPSLWETVRYRLKYCLEGPLNIKQPTNQPTTEIHCC